MEREPAPQALTGYSGARKVAALRTIQRDQVGHARVKRQTRPHNVLGPNPGDLTDVPSSDSRSRSDEIDYLGMNPPIPPRRKAGSKKGKAISKRQSRRGSRDRSIGTHKSIRSASERNGRGMMRLSYGPEGI